MKKIIFLLFTFYFLHLPLLSQPVTQEWVRRWNGLDNLDDDAQSITVDKLGNAYVTGVISTFTENLNIVTVKYNPSGVQQWAVPYAGPGAYSDRVKDIKVDSSGNVYITGYSGPSFGPYAYLTIKYNTNGVEQWIRKYENEDGQANGICLDKQGNIYVTGGKIVGNIVNPVTIKYDPSGDTLWIRKFTIRNGSGFYIATDDSSNVFVGGYSYLSNPNFTEFLLIKYNSEGVLQWYSSFTAPGLCAALMSRIALDRLGNCYEVGTQGNCTSDTTRILTVKYDRNGVRQWSALYKGPAGNASSAGWSIAVDSLGNNIYVTGFGLGAGTRYDYVTIKYNYYGDSLWVRRYNGTGNNDDQAFDLAIDDSTNVYITGESINSSSNPDFCTIKYSSSGLQRWILRYPGSASSNRNGKSILIDKTYNVFLTGSNSEMGTGLDYITIKYSQLVGITLKTNEIPYDYALYTNYPNPFNPIAMIRFDIPKETFVELRVYDITGREAAVLVNGVTKPGIHTVEFDGTNFASGVYFYWLKTGNFNAIKKMVLVK